MIRTTDFTPIEPPDDTSNICETWYTWNLFEFLMIILTNFCDGTTFHHLWDRKILSKRDDWIFHMSEVRFENRSRIESKLYIDTQICTISSCEYWTLTVVTRFHKAPQVYGSNPFEYVQFFADMLNVRSYSFLLLNPLSLLVPKPRFAEIFRYYIIEAQIIQNRGFRSTHNESWWFYTV